MPARSISKVTVVTVCLNARDTIRLTLESVRRQTFREIEHVIIDGASTDGTQDIVADYPIAYFVSEKDGGVYHAMEKGAKAATGDIVIFLNAGDTFYDDRVCEDIAQFFQTSGADIAFGNLMPVYLKPTDRHDHSAFRPGQLLDLGYMTNRRQLYDESIHHQATFYRAWVLQKCSYLCANPVANGEYNLLLSAVMRQGAKVKHIPRPISRFALGGISTGGFAKEWERYSNAREVLRQIYCPDQSKIKVRSTTEFCHYPPDPASVRMRRRVRAQQVIKRSLLFRVYDRLARGLTMRVVNAVSERHELHAQRLFNDLSSSIARQFQAISSESSAAQFALMEAVQRNVAKLLVFDDDRPFGEHGFKVTSQWDEDGLIQYLVSRLPIERKIFLEIGTGDYTESNTRFLLQNNNWSGLIIDARREDIERVRASDLYWRHSLKTLCAFVERDTINEMLREQGLSGEIGLLSIDVDGVDWWLWDAITVVSPAIVIIEYNGIFGSEAAVTVPYERNFDRTKKDPSWVYFGASLEGLRILGERKGYTLVGTNNGGNNAFFVRDDVLKVGRVRPALRVWTRPMFREARTVQGSLAGLDISDSVSLIAHHPLVDVRTGETLRVGDLARRFD